LETTIPPEQIQFFLRLLLKYIHSTRVSYDKAFKFILKKHYFPKWIIPSLYKIGYYTVNYYYTLKWLAAKHGFSPKPSGLVNFFASQGFSIKRIHDLVKDEVKNLSLTKRISIQYSYPEYLVRDLLKHISVSELEKILNSLNTRKRWVRINLVKTNIDKALKCLDENGFVYEQASFPEYMVFVKEPKWRPIGRNKCVSEGLIVPQDISSALSIEVLKPISKSVLDACSAPGLKLSLMYMFNRNGFFIGVDHSVKRIHAERKLLKRLGLRGSHYLLLVGDSREIVFHGRFQQSLIDAPCSGLGAVYSDPAVKINSPYRSKLEYYHNIQYGILKNILRYSDQVLYITCSIHPLEGEYVIERIVDNGYAEPIKLNYPFLSPSYRGFNIYNKTYRLKPHIVNGQGFYIALLESLVNK